MGDPWAATKYRDPFIFKKAEDFFREVGDKNAGTKRPTSVKYLPEDQLIDGKPNPACSHGAVLRFDDNALLLVQFMRPRVWRVRFHATNRTPSDFTDFNTRTIIEDTLTQLIKGRDLYESIKWTVEVIDTDDRYIIVQSVINPDDAQKRDIEVQLWIQRNPWRITAVRALKSFPTPLELPAPVEALAGATDMKTIQGETNAVIWQTKKRPLQYNEYATVLTVKKSTTAKFCGFGEQGGKRFFKDSTYMNYFNFDNMRYFNIYDRGPQWDGEPLYHSDPYWIEVNGLPGYQSRVATFIDNYSQICMDLSKGDPSAIRMATRFNSFNGIFFAGDSIQEIIQLFTSIVGRPRLKPRYILGNHQGCYGYSTQDLVQEAVQKYRQYKIPLDGMHVDVDIQDNYRTFSINLGRFPKPDWMFRYLRDLGVKCSTNITPFISGDPADWYNTLNEGLEKRYFVMDDRDVDPSAPDEWKQRYMQYGKGNLYCKNPSDLNDRPGYQPDDKYNYSEVFNSKFKPFHGGVDYGPPKGRPGHYPNLNSEEVRQWWGKQYQNLFNTGLEFVWQDMTSPCMSQSYGDMKSWPFRLLLDSDGWSGDPKAAQKKKAIEIWSLYSYNLHKATYHGLNKLPGREGKRNFIIGRGSFTGAHRFAGLWTGDNSSTWEFFDISVAQVLSLGLSGVTIAGADVGGFEPPMPEEGGGKLFADPELVVRWYGAYSLLPWFRNHYTRYGGKKFQEPYGYQEYLEHPDFPIPGEDMPIYKAVYPACQYVIRLRYSLLQLLYDALFENMINGLPLARAMVITDKLDGSLFGQNEWYTRSQYLVRNDLLVAPVLYRKNPNRKLYLPYPDKWYPMNLRPYDNTSTDSIGEPLQQRVLGGTYVNYFAEINAAPEKLPFITPMYIREGAIIPQIEVRDFVPDRTFEPEQAKLPANPVTINVYPGKDNVYDMYLDDGVSRESAPNTVHLAQLNHEFLNDPNGEDAKQLRKLFGDEEAKDVFTHIQIKQQTTRTGNPATFHRRVNITYPWLGYSWDKIERDIGKTLRVVFWFNQSAKDIDHDAKITGASGGSSYFDSAKRACVVTVPVQVDDLKQGVTIEVKHM